MSKSLLVMSRNLMIDAGYRVEKVEHYNAFSKRKKDLFNMFDLLCVGHGETIGLQVTDRTNVSHRAEKMEAADAYQDLLDAGWRIKVHGWYKQGGRWMVREEELT